MEHKVTMIDDVDSTLTSNLEMKLGSDRHGPGKRANDVSQSHSLNILVFNNITCVGPNGDTTRHLGQVVHGG